MKFIQLLFKTDFFQSDDYHIFVVHFQPKENIYVDSSLKQKTGEAGKTFVLSGNAQMHNQQIAFSVGDSKIMKIKHTVKKDGNDVKYISFLPFGALKVAFEPSDIYNITFHKKDKTLISDPFLGYTIVDQEESEIYKGNTNEHLLSLSANDIDVKEHIQKAGTNIEYSNRRKRTEDATFTRDKLPELARLLITEPVLQCYKHFDAKNSLKYGVNGSKESLMWKTDNPNELSIQKCGIIDVNFNMGPILRICAGSNIIAGGNWTQGYEGEEEELFVRSSMCLTFNVNNKEYYREEFYPLDSMESGAGLIYVPKTWIFRDSYVAGIGYPKQQNTKYQSYCLISKVNAKYIESEEEGKERTLTKSTIGEIVSKLHDIMQCSLFYGYRNVVISNLVSYKETDVAKISELMRQVARIYKTTLEKPIFKYKHKFNNIIFASDNPIIYNAFREVLNG